ncbi:MAG: hypothetical protein HY703_03005 [Gemmatimonadetes bacterium]|nr:hypothetical protein [Gemmatimonadota bacterium]
MQVRFFHGRELETLELALNTWLAERVDREIVDVRQSVIPATTGRGAAEFVVSVWYIEG